MTEKSMEVTGGHPFAPESRETFTCLLYNSHTGKKAAAPDKTINVLTAESYVFLPLWLTNHTQQLFFRIGICARFFPHILVDHKITPLQCSFTVYNGIFVFL